MIAKFTVSAVNSEARIELEIGDFENTALANENWAELRFVEIFAGNEMGKFTYRVNGKSNIYELGKSLTRHGARLMLAAEEEKS